MAPAPMMAMGRGCEGLGQAWVKSVIDGIGQRSAGRLGCRRRVFGAFKTEHRFHLGSTIRPAARRAAASAAIA